MPAWRTYRLPLIASLVASILTLHILALLLLRDRSLPLSYLIAGLAYLPAIALSLRESGSRPMRLRWLLFAASLIFEMLELLAAFIHPYLWFYLPTLFQVVSFTLCLLVVATPSVLGKSRWIKSIDVLLAASVCVLCTIAFLLPHDGLSDTQWLAFLTLIRLVPAVAAFLSMRVAATAERQRLMRFIAIYQTIDLLSAMILNQIMGTWLQQYRATLVDFFLEVPALTLALLMTRSPSASFHPAGRSRFIVRSGLPLFLSLTVLTLGFWLLPRSPLAGGIGIAIAILGYAARSTLTQGHVMETEEQLRHSVAQLRELADRDPLTNAGNRRAFDRIIRQQWNHATPESPLALILMDLDLFKQINDSMGHLYGDRCLRAVTSVLNLVAKDHDAHVCRFGGDEFAMILPHTPLHRGAALADRICSEVRHLALRAPGGAHLTVSLGIAASSPVNGHTIASLIAEADDNLNHAKRSGRDRIQQTPPNQIPLADDQLHTLVLRVAALALRAKTQ